jgi:NitT/TauT family transport system ATP-binding protein
MVFQEFALFPWLSVADNIGFGLDVLGTPRRERNEIVARYLKTVRLTKFAGSYPAELSGGMKQRVAIARALAVDPEALLMDEPFGALDAITKASLQRTILALWEKRQTSVIFITHDLTEAIALSDRVAVMTGNPGRIRRTVEIRLSRPRDVYNITDVPNFKELRRELWQLLEPELVS